MSGPSIRVSPSTDAAALSAVARATFLETFADIIPFADIARRAADEDSEAGMEAMLREGPAWIAAVEETDVPVGYALVSPPDLPSIDTDEGDLELKRIYLMHRFHGQGVGRRLLEAAIAHARERTAGRLLLGVYHANPTLAWYERQGFAQIGTRRFRVGGRFFDDRIMALAL